MSMYDETTNETFKRGLARKAIIEIAQGMLDGSVELLAGCRRLVRLRIEAAASVSPAFNAITGVESETDDYPLGEGRNAFSAELLAKLDSEVSTYLSEVRPAVLQSCREIIEEVEALEMNSSGNSVQ